MTEDRINGVEMGREMLVLNCSDKGGSGGKLQRSNKCGERLDFISYA